MTDYPEPIWRKELDKFVLLEFPKAPHFLNCSICYEDEESEIAFHFGAWGMEREEITQEMCFMCCQCLLDADANVSFCSFKDDLEYAENYFYEVDDEIDE